MDARLWNRKFKLQKGEYRDAKKQGRIAMALGLAGLIPKTYLGYQGYKKSGQTANDVIELAKEIDSLWGGIPTK